MGELDSLIDGTDWAARAGNLSPRSQLFIDGRFVDAASGRTFEDRTPRDGALLAHVAEGDAEDMDRAVRAARVAFEDGRWADAPPAHRKRVLCRLADLMRERIADLALLEAIDVGKPIRDAVGVDVTKAAETMQWYGECVDKLYDEVAPAGPDVLATITREPMGVVGAVVPWNYPLIITAWKLGPALATGNSVVLKPAEQSPLSALMLAELAAEAGLPDGVLNVVPGFGPTAGAALGRHMDVDKLTFTGSTEVGRYFLGYSAESNGKAVSLELGGKSPQIVLGDAPDLDAAAAGVAWGIFYNSGQTCNAGSRLIVQREIEEEFLDAVVAATAAIQPADPLLPDTPMGSVVDTAQMERVLGYIDIGRTEGAEVLCGGGRVLEDTGGAYVAPTVFRGVRPDMRIAREEIFGPVLASLTVADVDEAVRAANDSPFGLAASVWTRDVSVAHRVARRLRAGTVWINTFDEGSITVPFGGFKQSGTGRDRSLHAIEGYTHLKTTWLRL